MTRPLINICSRISFLLRTSIASTSFRLEISTQIFSGSLSLSPRFSASSASTQRIYPGKTNAKCSIRAQKKTSAGGLSFRIQQMDLNYRLTLEFLDGTERILRTIALWSAAIVFSMVLMRSRRGAALYRLIRPYRSFYSPLLKRRQILLQPSKGILGSLTSSTSYQ